MNTLGILCKLCAKEVEIYLRNEYEPEDCAFREGIISTIIYDTIKKYEGLK